jgi:hypothetical protein
LHLTDPEPGYITYRNFAIKYSNLLPATPNLAFKDSIPEDTIERAFDIGDKEFLLGLKKLYLNKVIDFTARNVFINAFVSISLDFSVDRELLDVASSFLPSYLAFDSKSLETPAAYADCFAKAFSQTPNLSLLSNTNQMLKVWLIHLRENPQSEMILDIILSFIENHYKISRNERSTLCESFKLVLKFSNLNFFEQVVDLKLRYVEELRDVLFEGFVKNLKAAEYKRIALLLKSTKNSFDLFAPDSVDEMRYLRAAEQAPIEQQPMSLLGRRSHEFFNYFDNCLSP